MSNARSNLLDSLSYGYFYVFDHFVLYPLMRNIGKTYDIEFLNLGYVPKDDEMQWARNNVKIEDEATKAHYLMYEKALSLLPFYPTLNVKILDVGCGLGGGIRRLKV